MNTGEYQHYKWRAQKKTCKKKKSKNSQKVTSSTMECRFTETKRVEYLEKKVAVNVKC